MSTTFDGPWTVQTPGAAAQPVILPHDAMIAQTRTKDAPSGTHNAWFPGGRFVYETTWQPPADLTDRCISLFFEGVHGATTVRVNGARVAAWNSGYREVAVPLHGLLTAGSPAHIEVDVDHTALPDARWYTGSGLYRDVHLLNLPKSHLIREELRTSFMTDGAGGELVVSAALSDHVLPDDEVQIILRNGDHTIAHGSVAPADGRARVTLGIANPLLWSAQAPHLHELTTRLIRSGSVIDEFAVRIGLRTVTTDPSRGLRINGESVLLRGACIHHDNGVVGAATFRAAEFRRVKLLKDAGYNAIRSAHNPASRHLLDACDELGMYLVDELTDVWFLPKTASDGATRFDDEWPADALSMVRKDRLHPSVIMYSIGNENPETATERGVAAARDIAALLRAEDGTRPVTTGINFMLNAVSSHTPQPPAAKRKTDTAPSALTSTMINAFANRLGTVTQLVSRLPSAERNTRQVAQELDVTGYNYAWGRYRSDARRHPDRVMLGTESLLGDLPRIWPRVREIPALIGDFSWTGWDYLGEAGIGSWTYDGGRRASLLAKNFPHLIAGPGAIDITGLPGAPVALQKAVWGLLEAPSILVRPLHLAGVRPQKTVWRSSDAVASWSWRGYEGQPADVEVYSADAEVELFLNGRSFGRKRSGARSGYLTRYTVPYEPGEIVAVGYDGHGRQTARSVLTSAGSSRLRLRAEAPPTPNADVTFVWAEISDSEGVVDTAAQARVEIGVEGPGTLAGFGSAEPAPRPAETFADHVHDTYHGRALIVLRTPSIGDHVRVTAHSTSHGADSVDLTSA